MRKTFVAKEVQKQLNQEKEYVAIDLNLSDYEYCLDSFVPFLIVLLAYINSNEKLKENKDLISGVLGALTIVTTVASIAHPAFGQICNSIKNLLENKSKESPSINDMVSSSLTNIKSYEESFALLKAGLSEANKKIIIFVDDFDRVTPQFAFKVLNIIHKIKNLPNIQICTIMNRAQLEQQLKHVYGNSLNNDEHYLTKFIDLEHITENPCSQESLAMEFLKKEFNIEIIEDKSLYTVFGKMSVREVIHLSSLSKKFSNSINKLPTQIRGTLYMKGLFTVLFVLYVKFKLELDSCWYGLLEPAAIADLKSKLAGSSIKHWFDTEYSERASVSKELDTFISRNYFYSKALQSFINNEYENNNMSNTKIFHLCLFYQGLFD